MKKWSFWGVMCAISLLNGGIFYRASLQAMERGIEGVDNQGALLFIPLFWVLAAAVLAVLNLATLIGGIRMGKHRRVSPSLVLGRSGLPRRERAGRRTFWAVTVLLMGLGYWMFAQEGIWAVLYALSGGALLVCLYLWRGAGRGTTALDGHGPEGE